jgi:hypothetical protein
VLIDDVGTPPRPESQDELMAHSSTTLRFPAPTPATLQRPSPSIFDAASTPQAAVTLPPASPLAAMIPSPAPTPTALLQPSSRILDTPSTPQVLVTLPPASPLAEPLLHSLPPSAPVPTPTAPPPSPSATAQLPQEALPIASPTGPFGGMRSGMSSGMSGRMSGGMSSGMSSGMNSEMSSGMRGIAPREAGTAVAAFADGAEDCFGAAFEGGGVCEVGGSRGDESDVDSEVSDGSSCSVPSGALASSLGLGSADSMASLMGEAGTGAPLPQTASAALTTYYLLLTTYYLLLLTTYYLLLRRRAPPDSNRRMGTPP